MTTTSEEIRNRIRLTIAAYAYEFCGESVMTDDEFDQLALKINPDEPTGNVSLDRFFRTEFVAHSGIWIRNHPDLEAVQATYEKVYSIQP